MSKMPLLQEGKKKRTIKPVDKMAKKEKQKQIFVFLYWKKSSKEVRHEKPKNEKKKHVFLRQKSS